MATILRAFGILLLGLATAAVRADEPFTAGDAQAGEVKESVDTKNKPAKRLAPAKQAAPKKDSKKQTAKKTSRKESESSNKNRPPVGKSVATTEKPSEAEREQAALALVREHHPDLVELLQRLKTTKKKDYRQAVRELYRDSQRLESFRQRDAERYGLELRAWQLASSIRLLTAKLSLQDRPELQEELKSALAEQADVRLAIKKLERDRLAARLSKVDEEIANLTVRREEELKRGFDRLLNAALKARPAAKGKSPSAAGPAPETASTANVEQTREQVEETRRQGDKETRETEETK